MDSFNVGFSLRVVPLDLPGVQAEALSAIHRWYEASRSMFFDEKAQTVQMLPPTALRINRLAPAMAVDWVSGGDWRHAHLQRGKVLGSLKQVLDEEVPQAHVAVMLFDNDPARGDVSFVLHGTNPPMEVIFQSSMARDWLRAAGEPADGEWTQVCKSPLLHQLIMENVFQDDVWAPVRTRINAQQLTKELPQGIPRPTPPRL